MAYEEYVIIINLYSQTVGATNYFKKLTDIQGETDLHMIISVTLILNFH
jgi:hypothetical protein